MILSRGGGVVSPEQKLGWYIYDLRLNRGWTLEELSKKSGLSIGHLSFIENGRRGISVKSLCRLANAFGMSASTLLKKSGYELG